MVTTLNEYLNKINNINDNFIEWFGNSKIVDDDGKPLVVYHGTNREIDVLFPSKYGSNGPGIYLTPYKEIAETHGKFLMELYVKIENDNDGIVAGYEIIVKKPQNIKSIHNDGSWNIDDKNIYS